MVGYEVTPWAEAVFLLLPASASTLAIRTLGSEAKSVASCSQVGARLLQSVGCQIGLEMESSKGSQVTYVRTTEQ